MHCHITGADITPPGDKQMMNSLSKLFVKCHLQVLPVSTHKSAKLTRLRSSRVGEADEWCEAPAADTMH
jgi:hypothetical protein